jgi:hypothetical protein
MTAPPTLLEARVEALREFLHSEQQHQSQELLDRGRQRAAEILRGARRAARVRMRETVKHERARMTEAVAKAHAAQQTERRERRLALLRSILGEAWHVLPQALERRWREPEQRMQWCLTAVDLARKYLQDETWQVNAAAGLDEEERQRIVLRRSRDASAKTIVTEVGALRAGLVIMAGGARLDASIAGLLCDRPRIEALLIAELETAGHSDP